MKHKIKSWFEVGVLMAAWLILLWSVLWIIGAWD